jgi:hypothetical protein
MIARVRFPEDIFREERRDVYALDFSDSKAGRTLSRKQMEMWLAEHLPASSVEMLAPSEHSGWIFLEGSPTGLSVDFADGDLLKFFKKWLTRGGISKDPRFKCVFYSYQHWWTHHGHFMPTLERPKETGVSVWIESPIGILSHTIVDARLSRHPSTPQNIWLNACEQWPQLRKLKLEQLSHGAVDQSPRTPGRWSLICDAPDKGHSSNPKTWKPLLKWLRLPANTEIYSDGW